MQSSKPLFFGIIAAACIGVAVMYLAQRLLITSNPIVLSILYSTEKEAWLQEAVEDFAGQVNGRPIELTLKQMGSQEIYLAVLEGSEQPDVISPASSLQISILHDLSTSKFGTSLVDMTNTEQCRSMG